MKVNLKTVRKKEKAQYFSKMEIYMMGILMEIHWVKEQ
jgi:hypothetical protein